MEALAWGPRASPRNPLASLTIAPDQELHVPLLPPPAVPEATLLDLENFETEGPLASTTLHESQRTQPQSKSRHVPPVLKVRDGASEPGREPESPHVELAPKQDFAQWSVRAIRLLASKSPKLKGKGKKVTTPKLPSPPAGSFRPLSLVQGTNLNQAGDETRLLAFGGKSKATDENVYPEAHACAVQGQAYALALSTPAQRDNPRACTAA